MAIQKSADSNLGSSVEGFNDGGGQVMSGNPTSEDSTANRTPTTENWNDAGGGGMAMGVQPNENVDPAPSDDFNDRPL